MKRIAHKSRKVKGGKGAKRYVIRKDSLDRQYAIDKLTGRRVSIQKAKKELKPRKLIPRHIPPKPRKTLKKVIQRKPVSRKRSEAAKKGWETRRKRAVTPLVLTPPVPPVPISALPQLVQLYEPMADRMARFPNVKRAAEYAFAKGQQEEWERRALMLEGAPPPLPTGKAYIRMLIEQRIQDAADIDRVVEEIYEEFDHEHSLRELYEIHFSPEVA
jgi:hypothetical protein